MGLWCSGGGHGVMVYGWWEWVKAVEHGVWVVGVGLRQ